MPQTSSLIETQFVAYFNAPLNVTMLDMADLASVFKGDMPEIQQLPAAAPVELDAPITFNFNMQEAIIPRIIMRSYSIPFAISFQLDRFSFSWVRTSDLGKIVDYPGYDKLTEEWHYRLGQFEDWHNKKLGSAPIYRLVELTYTNSLPLMKVNGESRRLSEVFAFVSPGSRPVNAFQANWTEMFERKTGSPRVMASTGVGLLSGIAGGSNEPGMYFNFTGYGPLQNGSEGAPTMPTLVDALHERILDVYRNSIISAKL